jgi:hypothetical protein
MLISGTREIASSVYWSVCSDTKGILHKSVKQFTDILHGYTSDTDGSTAHSKDTVFALMYFKSSGD